MKSLLCRGLALQLGLAQLAAGGTAVSVTDTCTPEERSAASAVKPELFFTRDNPHSDKDLVIRELGGQSLGRPCQLETIIHPRNEPDGPSLGDTKSAADLGEAATAARLASFYQWFINTSVVGQSGSFPPLQCIPGFCQLPSTLQAGAGFQIVEGRSGSNESSGTYELLVTEKSLPDAAELSIPFVVMTGGTDDWLEFSNWGVTFWKTRVSDLSPGKLYFAVVPGTAIRPVVNVWGFFLDTTPPANTSIYVPRIAPPGTAPAASTR